MCAKVVAILVLAFSLLKSDGHKIQNRALQRSREKPQIDKWMENIIGKKALSQYYSLANLLSMISNTYLKDCTLVILYDVFAEQNDDSLQYVFDSSPFPFVHGQICANYKLKSAADVMRCKDVIGEQNVNKVIIVARSSQWRINEFLSGEPSQYFVNLLIISQSEKQTDSGQETPYVLYTHQLFIDGIGSSVSKILTSWRNNSLTRPDVNLFPEKMKEGFSGHRFIISLASQPPFVIERGMDENNDMKWDGLEVRLLKLLGEKFNFSTDFRSAEAEKGLVNDVISNIQRKRANIGLSGIYVTPERISKVDVSYFHSYDCASFITLTSTALPRYRAIMGPFHWSVWLALTMAYLFIIFPLAFSDKFSLKYLLTQPEEIENMFWYVFGTFTNCFTFGAQSWTNSTRLTTRVLIGFYWLFTIITTACYTGSIIAFITLPIYPATVDTVKQLFSGYYQTGTLDSGGWEYWFQNSSDPSTIKLLKYMEFLPNVESGLRNVTKAFFWPYAFLGSRAQLDYIVRTNFTTTNKRSLLHISSECFVPYSVAIIFPKNSIYENILNQGILQITQSGFMLKFKHDIEWEVMRSATGKLLQASSGTSLKFLSVEDRALTLDDTQGMFLLLGAGFLIGIAFLISECLGGCFNCCKRKRAATSCSSIQTNPRTYSGLTPRQKLDSIQYSLHESGLHRILDIDNENVDNHGNDCGNNIDKEGNSGRKTTSDTDSRELSNEIDKLFNFDELFGEKNHEDNITTEELNSENELS